MGNHHNAWRPAHIHFSLFGHSFLTRLVTQMYFPGDSAVPVRSDLQFGDRREGAAAHGLGFDLETTVPEWALGFRFDIVLRGREADASSNG